MALRIVSSGWWRYSGRVQDIGGSMFVPVIGAGTIARRHQENLTSLGVRTMLLPWRSFDATLFRTLGADAAVIATATQDRLEPIRLCADLGLPFYVEKPLAFETDTLDDILRAAAPVAARSMVGFMMRYHPAVRALAARDLSQVYAAEFGIGHDVRLWRKDWSFAASYAARPSGGGVLLDLCHEIDMARVLLPKAQVADVMSLGHEAFPGVDFATRLSLVGPGLTGSVAMDYLSPVSYRRIVLRAASFVADFDLIAGRYLIDAGQGVQVLDLPFQRNDMFLAAMRDFLHLVAGQPVPVDTLRPRLDLVADSCHAIALAWHSRRFTGRITGEYA
jgi:predicted dehydrogenase